MTNRLGSGGVGVVGSFTGQHYIRKKKGMTASSG